MNRGIKVLQTFALQLGHGTTNEFNLLFYIIGFVEKYPSLVEGTGLENREVVQAAQGFESLLLRHDIAGWSSLVARWAHNPKVRGSNPLPATNLVF